MNDLGNVAWPPAPIRTERLVLREPEARDRAAFVELLASPEVHTYLGGHRPRDELEREMPEVPERWPGSFVVDLGGMMGVARGKSPPEHHRQSRSGMSGFELRAEHRPAEIGRQVRCWHIANTRHLSGLCRRLLDPCADTLPLQVLPNPD